MASNPYSVQLEVVEGCNFRCWFCGIHSIRGKEDNFKYMDPEAIVRPAARELNSWLSKVRFELNNHGEPTLHPRFFDIVKILRQEMPRCQVQLQSNGSTFLHSLHSTHVFICDYFDAGGNILALNCYKPGYYETAMKYFKEIQERGLKFQLIDFYYDNPENISAYHNHGHDKRMVFIFQDLGAVNVDKLTNKRLAKKILNEGGNSPEKALEVKLGVAPVKEPLKRCCSRVFRELTIGWDGAIPACCYDWKNELVFGKFPEQSLREIWEGLPWQAARVLLHPRHAERHMDPCAKCDYNGGFRTGLLQYPDSDLTIAEAYEHVLQANDQFGSYRYPRY